MDYFELNDSTYIEIVDNKTEKDIVASEKVQEMYDKILNIDSDAELEILSNTYVMDSGTDRYYFKKMAMLSMYYYGMMKNIRDKACYQIQM